MFLKRIFCFCILLFICQISLAAKAMRIITLAPNLMELLCDIGAEDSLVGVAQDPSMPLPPALKKLPIVSVFGHVDFERIVALKPDLILAWKNGNSAAQIAKLKALHLKVVALSFNHLNDLPSALVTLGQLTGKNKIAQEKASMAKDTLSSLKKRYANQKKVRVFYEISSSPLMTINDQTFVGDAITLCGGENIFGRLFESAPIVSLASVLKRDPEVILLSGELKNQPELKTYWLQFSQITAVYQKRIYLTDPALERFSLKAISAVAKLCQQIHTH